MRKIATFAPIVLAVSLAMPGPAAPGPGDPGQLALKPQRTLATVTPPKISASKMDRPGPVKSPDPYYTIKVGEAEIYRDAKDPSLAYYKPVIRLARRIGTPLAEGVGSLAATLDGFRFQYYKFESGGNPKWASVQVVVALERPQDATLEAVQAKWKGITRLVALPLKLDGSTGTRMTLPYPPRAVAFSESGPSGAEGDNRWQYLSTNTRPTPPDLLTDGNNNALNEAKTKDFASLITSDLGDMPSFQPALEVRAVFSGWTGRSPFSRSLAAFKAAAPLRLMPSAAPGRRPSRRPRPPTKRAFQIGGQRFGVAVAQNIMLPRTVPLQLKHFGPIRDEFGVPLPVRLMHLQHHRPGVRAAVESLQRAELNAGAVPGQRTRRPDFAHPEHGSVLQPHGRDHQAVGFRNVLADLRSIHLSRREIPTHADESFEEFINAPLDAIGFAGLIADDEDQAVGGLDGEAFRWQVVAGQPLGGGLWTVSQHDRGRRHRLHDRQFHAGGRAEVPLEFLRTGGIRHGGNRRRTLAGLHQRHRRCAGAGRNFTRLRSSAQRSFSAAVAQALDKTPHTNTASTLIT